MDESERMDGREDLWGPKGQQAYQAAVDLIDHFDGPGRFKLESRNKAIRIVFLVAPDRPLPEEHHGFEIAVELEENR